MDFRVYVIRGVILVEMAVKKDIICILLIHWGCKSLMQKELWSCNLDTVLNMNYVIWV